LFEVFEMIGLIGLFSGHSIVAGQGGWIILRF
jgi:hypothetical protein